MGNEQNLTVGPVTAALLQSLRKVVEAQNLYFQAWEAVGGVEVAETKADAAAPLFYAVRDLIQGEITDNVQAWAADLESTQI